MAEEKKGFLLYCDFIHTLEKMPDDKAGLLFKHILRYVNDLNPSIDDLLVDITFEPIKQQLKRDLIKYEGKKAERSESGKLGNLKRWNIDLYNKVVSKEMTLDEAERIAKHRKTSHSDSSPSQSITNVADSVSVTDISTNVDNSIVEKSKNDFPIQKVSKSNLKWTELELQGEMLKFKNDYDSHMLREFYDYWTEKDKNGNMRINQPKYKTFEVGKRLSTWNRNNFNTKSVVNNQKTKTDEQQRNERVQEAGLAIWKQAMGLD